MVCVLFVFANVLDFVVVCVLVLLFWFTGVQVACGLVL